MLARIPRCFLCALALCVAPALDAAAGKGVPDEDAYRIKLQALRPGDHAGLLKLGQWCEGRGQLQWARTCYRRAVELGPSPSFAEANFNLARTEIALGKPALALPRLRLNAAKHDDARARELLKKLEDDASRRQRELLAEADAAFEAGRYDKASQGYAEAIREYRDKQLAGPLVQEEEILPKAAACRAALDAARRAREGGPIEPAACSACRANKSPGFVACSACEGSSGRARCAACGGLGAKLCRECRGLTQRVEDAGLDALLGKLCATLETPELKTLELRRAAQGIEEHLREAGSRELFLLAHFKPAWESFPLPGGTTLPAPLPQRLDPAVSNWWLDTGDWRIRAAVLLGWACRYARLLARIDVFREVRTPLYAGPDAAKLLDGIPEPGLELCAFPESRVGRFVAFEAALATVDVQEHAVRASIAGAESAAIEVVCWQPALKPVFARLAVGPWRSRIGRLESLYPFDLAGRLAKTPPGMQVTWVGRLLRAPLADPATIIELWDFRPLYPARYAPFVAQLKTTVDIALRDVRLDELLSIAETILGLSIATDGVPGDAWLVLIAHESTAGRMFAEVADVLGATFYLRGDRLCLGAHAPRAEAEAMARVLAHVKRTDTSFLVAGKGAPRLAPGSQPEPPIEDPLAAYRRAAAVMEYGDAVMHLLAVRSRLKGAERNTAHAKEMAAAELGDLLTGRVAVSGFARGDDLASLRVRDPQGREQTRFVRVRERGEKGLMVETTFGGSFFLPATQIADEKKVASKDWRDMTAAHVKARADAAEKLKGRARAIELYSLAVLAKTGGCAAEGHALVEKLLASPDFPWVLESFFPEARDGGLALWKRLGITPRETDGDKGPPQDIARPAQGKGPAAPAAGKDLPRDPAELRAFAVAQLAAGKEHIRNYRRRTGDSAKEWKAALDSLRRAREAFRAHCERSPDDREAQRLREDADLLFESCIKDTPFIESSGGETATK